jgi:hyperosmotically inducible periplasmic protein
MRSTGRHSVSAILALILLVVVIAAAVYYARNPSFRETFHSVRESSADAATTAKVRTALLVSKNVSVFDIGVATTQGEVTLSGQVPSEEVKVLAGAIAQDTSGVKNVRNDLAVNPAAQRNPEMERLAGRVVDLEIRTILTEALSKSPELKGQDIKVEVNKRAVTLTGTVETVPLKQVADRAAWQTAGVQGVTNNLAVTKGEAPVESADDKLARRVEFELYSTKAISLKAMQVRSQGGTLTLTGSVPSRAEKLLAEKVAQGVDGVRRVVNKLAAPEDPP